MHRTLGIQQLEARTMMAGDVSVFLSPTDARDLVIQGDGLDNSILIQEVGEDRFRISGRGTAPFNIRPTLINGSTTPVEFTVTDDIRVSMGGGNDRVEITDLIMRNFAHSDLEILMGAGSDELRIENSHIGDDATFDMGSGNDKAYIYELYVSSDLNVIGNDGHDYLDIIDNRANNLQVFGGSGDESVYLGSNRANQLVASLEAGDDHVWLGHNVAGNAELFGGSGNDSYRQSWLLWNSFGTFSVNSF